MAPKLPSIPLAGRDSPCLARGCSVCCHDTEMLLTEADVLRLAVARPGLDFAFVADDGFLQLRTRDAPPAPGMAGKPCVFLDGAGRCSVWDDRPEGCRLYPGVWDGDALRAHLDADHCPHTDGFLLPRSTQDAVARLAARLQAELAARQAKTAAQPPRGRDGLSSTGQSPPG